MRHGFDLGNHYRVAPLDEPLDQLPGSPRHQEVLDATEARVSDEDEAIAVGHLGEAEDVAEPRPVARRDRPPAPATFVREDEPVALGD